MSKHKDPLVEALREGRSYTWTVPEGGDLASMRAAIKHGQTLTMSPITNPDEIKIGDMVLLEWRQGYILHLVHEIHEHQFLIVNSVGKINGWVSGSEILGRVTNILDPRPRPSLPEMLDELENSYHKLIEIEQLTGDDAQRLLSVAENLRWYAGRVGAARWDQLPRSNKWSFEQIVWRLVQRSEDAPGPASSTRILNLIDQGNECVGLAAEMIGLFDIDGKE